MRVQVFSVYDKAVKLFMPPIYMRSEGEAVRALRVAMLGEHSFAQSPDDYALFQLGEFDEATGAFSSEGTVVRFVCELRSLVGKKEE